MSAEEEDLDSTARAVIEAFDASAHQRARELLQIGGVDSPRSTLSVHLESIRVSAFCLGYKAGVVDLSTSIRKYKSVDLRSLELVFHAACAWRDSPEVTVAALAGEIPSGLVTRLIAAIDAARKE